MLYPLSRKAVTQREMVGIETPTSSASMGVEYRPVRIRLRTWSKRRSISRDRSNGISVTPFAVGVANFPGTTPAHGLPQMSMRGVTPRGGEVDVLETGSAPPQPAAQVTPPAPPGPNWWLWGGGAVLLVILLLVLWRHSAARTGR